MINPLSSSDFSELVLPKVYGDDEGGDNNDQGDHKRHHDFRKFFKFKSFDRDNKDNNHKHDKKGDDNKNKEQNKAKIYKGFGFDPADGDNKIENTFNFAAVGDFGCSKNAKNTVENIKDSKPELLLPLGDLSYQKNANCWFDIISPLKHKLMITLGYHDVNDGQDKTNQFYKSFDLNKPYYSFDYSKVHFIVMASESNFGTSSEQYQFVKQDLEESSNKDVNWIIVTSYGPFYTSPSKHNAEKDLRDIYHPLFEKYNVDLVLQAHNHNYQRTYPISYNSAGDSSEPVMVDQVTTGYNSHTEGTIFAIVGTGGESFYPLAGQAPYVASQFDRFGFLNIDISNGNPQTKLTGTFYDNKGSEVRDQFTIEKEIK